MRINIPEIETILHKLKASTDTSLRSVQRSIVPHFYNLELTRVTKYIYNEEKFRSKKLLYRVDNIDYIKHAHIAMMYDLNLLDAINNNYIKPFILFMNGLMVDYKKIRIITDSRNTYLELDIIPKFDIYRRTSQSKSYSFPPIPEAIKDKVYINVYPEDQKLIMSVNGTIQSDNSIINSDILSSTMTNHIKILSNNTITGIRLSVKEDINIYNIKSFGEDCIVFPDYTKISTLSQGQEYPKGDIFLFDSNGALIENEEQYDSLNKPGGTLIRYNNILQADIIKGKTGTNGIIDLKRNEDYKNSIDCIFGFNNGMLINNIRDYGANVYKTNPNTFYKAYYYKEFKNVDNITRFTKMTDYYNHLISGDNIDYVENILNPLDFIFDQGKLKIDRIKEVVFDICKHNPNLLQEYVDSKSRIKTEYYDKEDIINLSSDEGEYYQYKMRRVPHGKIHGISVIVFMDGLLYNQDNITYDDDYVYIKLYKYKLDYSNYIELMIFYDTCNDNIKITYDKNNPEFLLSNYIPFEDIQILSHDIDNHIYQTIPKSEELQYEIPNILSDLGKGYINLDFPEYYDGRDVVLSSRRKFLYERYEITDNEMMIEELYKILLPESFRFCSNKGQFILFHNGRKISDGDAVVCLNKWNLPFNKRFIHLNKKCEIGDIIDIYYVPDELSEVYFSETIEERGYIHINYDDLGYTLDGKNSSVFINGKRVPFQYIETVGNDHARINIDTESRRNISVVKHLYFDDIVFQIMRTIESDWDRMIKGLSDEELDTIFDFEILLTDTEPDIRENLYPTFMVLYEVLRRYWIEAMDKVNIENPLFYVQEYDGQKILRIDSSIYSINVPKLIEKRVDTSKINIYTNGIYITPIDANKKFINSKDIDYTSYSYYNPNAIVIPNDANIFGGAHQNIIDIIEATIIDKNDIYKFSGRDHLRIDGTNEDIHTLDIIDRYFYQLLVNYNIGNEDIFRLDATRRFIEYKILAETPEYKQYFQDHVSLIMVIDAAIEYLINANLGAAGDIYIDANKTFPYYWDRRIVTPIDKDLGLVGIPFNSNLDSIVEISNSIYT